MTPSGPAKPVSETVPRRNAEDWTAEEKLRAVFDARTLSGQALDSYLRREGLEEAQLAAWREVVLHAFDTTNGSKAKEASAAAAPLVLEGSSTRTGPTARKSRWRRIVGTLLQAVGAALLLRGMMLAWSGYSHAFPTAIQVGTGFGAAGLLLLALGHRQLVAMALWLAPFVAVVSTAAASLPEMVRVPAGPFEMGSDVFEPNERPVRRVELPAFWIDVTEVTVRAYARCVSAGACTSEGLDAYGTCNWKKPDRGDHPINCVDWSQARIYCAWAGKRLPTEAEWEKAARGTDGRLFPWGNQLPDCTRAVMEPGAAETPTPSPIADGCGRGSTWPVGSKTLGASPYGVLDLAGNVWEWVADVEDARADGRLPAPGTTAPEQSSLRIVRGGAWSYTARNLRSTLRREARSIDSNGIYGFRCARDDPERRDTPSDAPTSTDAPRGPR